jgi:uncharacterized protein
MKRLLTTILFFALGTNLIMAQDFFKGLDAYEAGDYTTAMIEWKPLAEKGDANAQLNVGFMYKDGLGVIQDYTEAVKWLRMSAEQGHEVGQIGLGMMYKYGDGVLQDNVTSHMWYNIASANGHKEAGEYRDERAAFMTTSDISKAQAMARECMKSDYKKCGY